MAKTEELPGVTGEGIAPKRIKRLDNAVEAWRGIVAERQELTERECKCRDKCVAIMHEENLKSYRYWDQDDEQKDLVLVGAEKLKLQKIKEFEPESETGIHDD